MHNIKLGSKIKARIRGRDYTCIVIVMKNDFSECIVHSAEFDPNNFYTLGSQVKPGWRPNVSYIDNIESYHGKRHYAWIVPENVLEVIDETAYVSSPNKSEETGCFCSGCQVFNVMAEPNQPDNTFKCYACRSNPMRVYY